METVDRAVARVQHKYVTAKNYPPELKADAYSLFMKTSDSYADIGIALGIDAAVVSRWAKEGGWLEKRREQEAELFRMADDRIRKFVAENRLPTLQRHLRVGGKLEEAIEKVIDDTIAAAAERGVALDSRVLKRLAEALSSVTGVTSRAVMLADGIQKESAAGGGKVPLVMINTVPRVPEDRGPVVEVNAE